jgi:hypothetical protein
MKAQAFEMMQGSEKHMDYVVLARRGRFKIGLKIVGVAHTKLSGKSYVAVRIRSAVDETYEKPEVPNLATEKLTNATAWPGIAFDNVDETRASTNGGVFINGDFEGEIETLMASLKDTSWQAAMCGSLIGKLVGEQGVVLVLTPEQLISYFGVTLKPVVDKLQERLDKMIEITATVVASTGVFQLQADLMKKLTNAEHQLPAPVKQVEVSECEGAKVVSLFPKPKHKPGLSDVAEPDLDDARGEDNDNDY